MNTTSTADISFMLLVFFLVTTSIITEQGLLRRLAPIHEEEQEIVIKREEVMQIAISSDDVVTVDGEVAEDLGSQLQNFIDADPKKHVISITADRASTYNTYFHLQRTVIEAYATLRAKRAMSVYGKSYADCTDEEKQEINGYYPLRLSDTTSDSEEGGEQ